jgi:hypothetical protein
MTRELNTNAQFEIPRRFRKKRNIPSTLKTAVVAGVTAALVTIMVSKPEPAPASAAVLLSPLATIGNKITGYLDQMTAYVDSWMPDLSGVANDRDWTDSVDTQQQVNQSTETSSKQLAEYHARGDAPYVTSLYEQISPLRDESGHISPTRAAERLAPPNPIAEADVSNESVNAVWEHALLVTGDEPIPEVNETRRNTVAGTEYEYDRLQMVQSRLLAQDAIRRYPLSGPSLDGYRKHLSQFEDNGKLAALTPGQLLGAQLDIAIKVQAPLALDQLESSLRQERMLGALLAQEIKPQTTDLIGRNLSQ